MPMKEVVCFFIKGREFGVDVSQMKTIAHTSELKTREKLPEFIKGIVDIHGEQIPLVDIEQLLRIPDVQAKAEKRFVVLISKNGEYAIESDGISEIVMIEDKDVQHVPGFFNKDETNYADCVIRKNNNTLVVVIDPDGMMNDAQTAAFNHVTRDIRKEREEELKRKREEERRRKEEEKRKREEEIAQMEKERMAELTAEKASNDAQEGKEKPSKEGKADKPANSEKAGEEKPSNEGEGEKPKEEVKDE